MSTALLPGVVVFTSHPSHWLSSTTPWQLWLEACVLLQRTILFPRGHPTCWASSQRSYSVSCTLCHGAWTSAPLGAQLSTDWECRESQIGTPICTRRATTHQFIWGQQLKRGAVGASPMECGVVGQHLRDGSRLRDNRMAAQHLSRVLVRPTSGLKELLIGWKRQ